MIYRLLLVCTLVLGGCATPELRPIPSDPAQAWKQRLLLLANLQTWDLQARIAVKAGESGGQANLHWGRKRNSNDMRLVGAWGKGLIRLSFNKDKAELTNEAGQITSSDNATELLYRATGWLVPVQSLRSWMAGVPVSDQADTRLDKYGRLKQITESGWQIDYQEYKQFGQWELPRKLKLSQLRSVNGEQLVSVRLVVNSWKVKG